MSERARKIIDDMVRRAVEENGPGDAEAVVCRRADEPAIFDDDLFTVCSECGVDVRYRPYMPDLPKICLDCAGLRGAMG